jgi:predicted glycogen debranching enzyme
MIQLGREICNNLEAALAREWLETNGLGGFASSTVAGVNTRRYHGLLTATLRPPLERFVLLSKLEETLLLGGQRFELSANRYPGTVHPRGYEYLASFRLDPFPVFTYEIEGVEVEKTIFMVHGENTTVVQYAIRLPRIGEHAGSTRLEVRPLIAFRDYHATTHENGSLDGRVRAEPGLASVNPYPGLPTLYFAHNALELNAAGTWYRSFEYDVERERGLDFTEDLFSPFALTFEPELKGPVVIASTSPQDAARVADLRRTEMQRRDAVFERCTTQDELVRSLIAASDQYVVAKGEESTIIAGYHWFSDWGRDTMIALPGLSLCTGRPEVARNILLGFAGHVDQGMLPNRFPDQGETPEYNTADATLWFFEAVRSLVEYTGDLEFVRLHLREVLVDIIDWHLRGTRYGIRVDEDGLLRAGEPGLQLTWMDAKMGDRVVTPRQGKPVEIQALWYNALRVMEDLSRGLDDTKGAGRYAAMAGSARDSFNLLFWNEQAGCLYDVVNGDVRDASIRPNQVLAISLRHSMVSEDRARRVLEVVERELLTPVGLRSLAPGDPHYRARYEGGVASRDGSYHQGTVWPWLMGPFISAYIRVHGRDRESLQRATGWLEGFREHLHEAGLGQISEILDAEPPHRPRGCIAQAWSVGELLRVAVQELGLATVGAPFIEAPSSDVWPRPGVDAVATRVAP